MSISVEHSHVISTVWNSDSLSDDSDPDETTEIGSDSELSSESDEDYDKLERKFSFIYTVV